MKPDSIVIEQDSSSIFPVLVVAVYAFMAGYFIGRNLLRSEQRQERERYHFKKELGHAFQLIGELQAKVEELEPKKPVGATK